MQRTSGVLLHISSLPSKFGIGSFGQSAYDFVDFLAKTGQQYWQILPLGTTSYGDSPYQSFSAFAGNTHFIDLDLLVEAGWLTEADWIIWDEFPGAVRTLLDTPYTFQPFWDAHNGLLAGKEWKTMFVAAKKKANFAFEEQETAEVLEVVFGHLYTLRNQLIHGGSTYDSSANRKQLEDACALLSLFVPAMVKIMLRNDDEPTWGKPYYPYVQQ